MRTCTCMLALFLYVGAVFGGVSRRVMAPYVRTLGVPIVHLSFGELWRKKMTCVALARCGGAMTQVTNQTNKRNKICP
jgi:hypothetical protein